MIPDNDSKSSQVLVEQDSPLYIKAPTLNVPLLSSEKLKNNGSSQILPTFRLNKFDSEVIEDECADKVNIKLSRKRLSFFNQSGIDIDDVFGFGGRISQRAINSKRISIHKRLSHVFGIKEESDIVDGETFFKSIPDRYAYGILALSVFLNSIIVPLMISIPEYTWNRNGWRFLVQAITLIPFVLWEYRTGDQKTKNCYTYKNLCNSTNIQRLFISSFNTSLQTTIYIITASYNYIANNILIGSMINFWLSITRLLNNDKRHRIEKVGQYMCVFGVLIITYDSYSMTPDDIPAKFLTEYSINDHFFIEPWKKLVLGIGVPVLIAIITTQISIYTIDLKDVYPPFIQLFLISVFTSINLFMVGYFFFCTTLDGTHFTGWFGYIVDGAFTQFMYYATVYSVLILLCQVFASLIFEPIIPASSTLLEPAFTAYFLHFFGQQFMPNAISWLGYILVIPGQFVILFGQYLIEKDQKSSISQYISKNSSYHQLKLNKNLSSRSQSPNQNQDK